MPQDEQLTVWGVVTALLIHVKDITECMIKWICMYASVDCNNFYYSCKSGWKPNISIQSGRIPAIGKSMQNLKRICRYFINWYLINWYLGKKFRNKSCDLELYDQENTVSSSRC